MNILSSALTVFTRTLTSLKPNPVPGKTAPRFKAPPKRFKEMTTEEQLRRTKRLLDEEARLAHDEDRCLYRLDPGKNGGRDPHALDPASQWTDGDDVFRSLDCSGYYFYVTGADRFQPETFPHYGGYMNTDSVLLDARGWAGTRTQDYRERQKRAKQAWWRVVAPRAGCGVVYGSVDRNGDEPRVGHIGKVMYVDTSIPVTEPLFWEQMRVAHCSSGNARQFGHAIAETNGMIWFNPDKYGRPKHAAFVDLVDY
jgi:hypothetical protein